MAECIHAKDWMHVGGGAFYCPHCKVVCTCDVDAHAGAKGQEPSAEACQMHEAEGATL